MEAKKPNQRYEPQSRALETKQGTAAELRGINRNEIKINYTPAQLKYLSWLNNELAKKEKELHERARLLFDAYEKRVKANSKWATKRHKNKKGDLDDYEAEVIVEFNVGPRAGGSTRYIYTERISYHTFDKAGEKEPMGFGFSKEKYPELKGSKQWPFVEGADDVCWLMWKFLDDLPVELRFKITDIWFEIHICEQNILEIVKYQYM
jgi:hypothetical protein